MPSCLAPGIPRPPSMLETKTHSQPGPTQMLEGLQISGDGVQEKIRRVWIVIDPLLACQTPGLSVLGCGV